MQHHADHIGRHDPIMRIDIHFVEPPQRLGRTHPGKEQKIPQHHEPLDMMIIPRAQHLPQALPEAIHLRLAGVEKSRKRPLRLEAIGLHIIRHLEPIDAIDEFPPPRNLSHESLHPGQGHLPLAVSSDRPLDAFTRGEQPEIEHGRDHRVEKKLITFHHKVLPRTKPRQPRRDEVIQPPLRTGTVDRQPEALGRARVTAELFFHQGHRLPRDPVRFFLPHLGPRAPRFGPITKGLAVLLVEIPPPSHRLAIRLHEKSELGPHPPVMRFHEE